MKKNRIAQRGEIGICAIASGYTTKARPGPNQGKQQTIKDNKCDLSFNGELIFSLTCIPELATVAMSLLSTCAMKPRVENMTKPAKTLVPQLISEIITASLEEANPTNKISLLRIMILQLNCNRTSSGNCHSCQIFKEIIYFSKELLKKNALLR